MALNPIQLARQQEEEIGTHTHREDAMRTQAEGDVDQSKGDASEETSPAASLVLDFRPPELGENKCLLLKPRISGASSWQP